MEILNKYVFGSRLYGTHTGASDWDLVIVVSDKTIHLAEQEFIKQSSTTGGVLTYQPATTMSVVKEMEIAEQFEYDKKVLDMRHFTLLFENTQAKVSHIIYSRSHFEDMIRANIIWAYELAYAPLTHDYMTHPKFGLEMRLLADRVMHPCKLVHSVNYESSYAIQKAKAFFKNGPDDFYRAQKNMFHAFRFLIFGMQIFSTSMIYSHAAANDYLDRTLTGFNIRYPESRQLPGYKDLMTRLDSWIKTKYPNGNSTIAIVRVIPGWLKAKYRYVDMRPLSPEDPVISRNRVKYMDREIRATDPTIGITKRELQEQGRVTQAYLEMLDYGADIPLIIRAHHVLAS